MEITGPRLGLLVASTLVLFGALLFVPAGRLDWWEGWVYFAATLAPSFVLMAVLLTVNPELARRRLTVGEGTAPWDRALLASLKLVFFAALVLAGLDAGRFGWCVLPWGTLPLGATLVVLGVSLLGYAMVVNPFFETTVRLQRDVRQVVVDRGPYAAVRHPGYAAFLLLALGTPLTLRSGWAFLPVALSMAILVVRTDFEDRLLRRELEGYDAYAKRVRYRLLPGVW